jgi:hypothetical protein
MSPMFFSPSWADAVGQALDAGPDEKTLEGKLPEYWEFYQLVRSDYPSSWALGVRDLPAELGSGTRHLRVTWGEGRVTDCRIVDGSEAVDATYVLAADYSDWKALHQGYDALRTVMYRKLLLEEGDLLEFFKGIYFFVESLALIAKLPTGFPADAKVPAPA